ncbi:MULTISPECIES: hypothetical protein [Pseudomonas fluorescens group]|uniref:Uncharacterized protein n=1 Tax=Pseudomonas kilonensis TaxID=132476 RepID=A0A0F4XVU6_9PSED|nr:MULTISPECIES: hypothetical protein [Pseudomonas fluorescens group]KKA10007.1 hypothetical protein VP02_01290 [Pseudomonas ogarae]WGT27984.1 hypothetical protein QGQ83_30710 [Pseudomonas marginalis]
MLSTDPSDDVLLFPEVFMTHTHVPIVVVGAAGGIGLEIVRLLQERVDVLGMVQNEGQLAAAKEAGARDCVVCNITDSEAVMVAINGLLTLSAGQIFMQMDERFPVRSGPFYAREVRACVIGQTGADLDINEKAQVLDGHGQVIVYGG